VCVDRVAQQEKEKDNLRERKGRSEGVSGRGREEASQEEEGRE
jgi:hypothetical protein